jgi:S-DNA-T family DNA segregation ATPase FtsK/SpoIIIE
MAKFSKSTFSEGRTQALHPIRAGMALVVALLLAIALWDYSPFHNPLISTNIKSIGSIGLWGTTTAFWLYMILGLASWMLPISAVAFAYHCLGRFAITGSPRPWIALLTLTLSLTGIFSLIEGTALPPQFLAQHYPNHFIMGLGGFVGFTLFNQWLSHTLGLIGSALILASIAGGSLWGILKGNVTFKPFRLPQWPTISFREWFKRQSPEASTPSLLPPPPAKVRTKPLATIAKEDPITLEMAPVVKPMLQKPAPATPEAPALKIVTSQPTQKAIDLLPQQKGSYAFPPLDLLAESPPQAQHNMEDHQEMADALLQTLSEFGVKVALGEIHTGPVITRYEVTPAAGVRVEKIASLDKNLALSLKATSIRILAPVPGKGSVGVEIPNRQASPVCLREIIESTAWAHSKAEIPVVLGKDVTGNPIVTDLTKMPHMLIAGSTGSGKTVCINTIIASLLYHSSPDDLRFIMVDPKIVEMQMYNSLPHMLIPVVTNPKLVPGALKWLISEMERRYHLFASVGVRNIAGFNAKILKDKAEEKKANALEAELSAEERIALNTLEVPRDLNLELPGKKLPYIVCIIDELADLMMVAPADIETCVARLAQLARAAGIHLILATQRPSVNVITGVIKANLPSRIAFKVASKVDSRTILDMGGADTLIGRGDMLFIPPGTSNLVRAQGAFVSDDEINAIVEYLKRNGPPQYVQEIQDEVENSLLDDNKKGKGDDEEWDDDLIPAALEVLRSTQRASTSILQRRLSIGYNRAARIMELLEAEGYVGPENGSKPREILKELV